MGSSGVDIQLSPAAKRVFNADIEVKAVEALNVYSIFIKHYNNYIKNVNSLKLLCHRKSRGPMLVTLRFDDFITMLDELLTFRKPGG